MSVITLWAHREAISSLRPSVQLAASYDAMASFHDLGSMSDDNITISVSSGEIGNQWSLVMDMCASCPFSQTCLMLILASLTACSVLDTCGCEGDTATK